MEYGISKRSDSKVILKTSSSSRQGSKSSINQDSILESQEKALFAVADGIGGGDHGEIASQMAIESLKRLFKNQTSLTLNKGEIEKRLHKAFLLANRAILRLGNKMGQKMGTTLTAVVIKNSICYVAHSGDSRAYLIKDKTVKQLTEDNTIVAEMAREGIITENEAKFHPHRNVLTGFLGLYERFKIQIRTYPWECNKKLILCTDGISDWISPEEMAQALLENSPSSIVEELISLALSKGSADDLSVIAVAGMQKQ